MTTHTSSIHAEDLPRQRNQNTLTPMASIPLKPYHVAVAAEAHAAAILARAGYEVSVQYGANQPGYDLVAVKGKRVLKISVKGSQVGGWALLAGQKSSERSWEEAVAAWKARQPSDVVMCFVEYSNVPFEEMPRIYLARPSEVAAHLLQGRGGAVSTCLWEDHTVTRGKHKGTRDKIPDLWRASVNRINQI